MALCRFQGQRDLSRGPRLAWGSGCPGLCARPFSSTSGPRKTDRRKQQHPSPSPYSSSICTAELDGPARMWRALLLQLFLVFICSVRWCHSEGKKCDFSPPSIFLFFTQAVSWMIHCGPAELLCNKWFTKCTCCSSKQNSHCAEELKLNYCLISMFLCFVFCTDR